MQIAYRNRIWCILALNSDIWCNNFNDFPENQLILHFRCCAERQVDLRVGGYDNLVYNVIWGGGSQKMVIFALYNMCTAPKTGPAEPNTQPFRRYWMLKFKVPIIMYHFKRSDMGLFRCVPIGNNLMTFGILCLVATLPNPQTATSDCRTPSSMRRSDEGSTI